MHIDPRVDNRVIFDNGVIFGAESRGAMLITPCALPETPPPARSGSPPPGQSEAVRESEPGRIRAGRDFLSRAIVRILQLRSREHNV